MRDSFHIGILRFREAWGASCLLTHANVAITHLMADTVSICCSVRLGTVSFRTSSVTVLYMWSFFTLFHRQPFKSADGKNHPSPMSKISTVALVHILSSSLAPYSMTPSVSILTGYGVVFQRGWDIVHLDLYLMLRTRGSFLLALLLTRRRFVFRTLFSIYKQHLLFIFHYFNPADPLERETVARIPSIFSLVC